jgi:DNA-binding IclR family transcriptional regulator
MPKLPPRKDSTATQKEDRQFVTALARGLDILRSFDANRTELGTVELANITGLPQPTVWRLCHTLVKCGFLTPSPTGDKLRIGMPVLGLGYAALSTMGFEEIMREEMQRLAVDFSAAVSLAAPDRMEMIIVQRARGNGMLLINLHVGSRLPMANSSFGWAYLATLAETERSALFKQMAATYKGEWPQMETRIQEEIARCHKSGYVINAGHYHREINAIAVPVVGADGNDTLVINCGAPATVMPVAKMKKEIAPRLLELADTIRAALVSERATGMAKPR